MPYGGRDAAGSGRPFVRAEHYSVARIAEGVTFAEARAGRAALSNSALVDLGTETLLFDTSLTPFAATELGLIAEEATGRRPTCAVNSHWHLDHLLGNQVLESIPTYATLRTHQILSEQKDRLAAEVSVATLRDDIRRLEAQVASAPSEAARRYLEGVLDLNAWVLRAAPELRLTLPNRTFEGRFALPGPRRAELLGLGSGHTESDTILLLADDRIVCAGDLVVVGTHPNLTSGDPEHWLAVLDAIDGLRPEQVVPGHGPLGTPENVAAMRDYLEWILALPVGPAETPEIPARFRSWSEYGQFEENLRFLRTRGRNDPSARRR